MFKLELLQNKLYAILLIVCTLPITFVEGDVTALVMASLLAVPMFFAKENWILGGDYENQESRRKDIRSRDVSRREKGYGVRNPTSDCRVQPEEPERDRRPDLMGTA